MTEQVVNSQIIAQKLTAGPTVIIFCNNNYTCGLLLRIIISFVIMLCTISSMLVGKFSLLYCVTPYR